MKVAFTIDPPYDWLIGFSEEEIDFLSQEFIIEDFPFRLYEGDLISPNVLGSDNGRKIREIVDEMLIVESFFFGIYPDDGEYYQKVYLTF
jgi:hypothetical protein